MSEEWTPAPVGTYPAAPGGRDHDVPPVTPPVDDQEAVDEWDAAKVAEAEWEGRQ